MGNINNFMAINSRGKRDFKNTWIMGCNEQQDFHFFDLLKGAWKPNMKQIVVQPRKLIKWSEVLA